MALTSIQKQDAYKFFIVAFGAPTGVEYMNQLDEAYGAGMTTKQIVNVYTTKPQFEAQYPRFLTNEQFADKLIENVVGASATAAAKAQAKADVASSLNAGWSKGDVVFQIFSNLAAKDKADPEWGATAQMLVNKAAVAEYLTETLVVNTTDLTKLASYIANVTADIASVEAAKGAAAGANGGTFMLTTGLDTVTANHFYASQTQFNVDGKGPTLNTGDRLTGMSDRTDNSLTVTDLTAGAANNNIPAGVQLNNIQNIILQSSGNTAGGTGFSTVGYADVRTLTGSTNGGGNDVFAAKNGVDGTVVNVSHNGFTGNTTVVGGTDVTATTAGGNVVVGNTAAAVVPLASQVATGAVVVNQNFTGAGAVSVFGGSTVNVTTSSTSNSGAIDIGNTATNTGNTAAGAIANASGNVTVNTAGTGAVNVFGGADVAVANTALSGAGAITVGDVLYRTASNLPTGNVTITESAAIAYNGLAGSANNNVLSGAISVHGGKDVSITTNAANAINVGQVGNAAKEDALNPTGAVTVTNTGVETAAATGNIRITGGTDVNVTTTGANVTIGRAANPVTDQASNPTGNVTVTETMNGAGFGRTVTIDGGTDVTVNAKGQTVTIGNSVASAPTGAVVVNQADIFTGNNAVLNSTNAGNVTVRGGTDVTVNTTGGNVTVGGVVGSVNTVPSGAVKVTNTFGGVGADAVSVQGGTTVDISTTKTSGNISVGAASAALNAAGTAFKGANLAPTGNVTIVNKTVSGSQTAYGTRNVDVNANGATTVSVTGGDINSIIDIQSTLATGGANAGKAVGTSTLKNVVIDNQQAQGAVAIQSDALTDLTVTNQKGGVNDVITITNNTAAHALTITQGGNSTTGSTVQIVDAIAGSLTIKDNGTASTNVLRVDATKATAVTIDNAAAAAINLGAVSSDIATVTLKGAGNVNLSTSGSFGTGNLSKAKTVDASAATGNVTAALQMTTTANEVQSYKGGAGVDTITVNSNASGWSSKATIDGGNGSADVLVANYAAAGTDVALGNAANVKGFEVLRLGAQADSTGGSYDASGFSTVQVGAVAGNVTFGNTAAGLTLDVLDNTAGTNTVTVNGANYSATNSAMTINLGTANTAAAGAASNAKVINGGGATTGAITANGIEALTVNAVANLVTAGAATQGNVATINGVASNGAATLTVGGAGNLTLTSNTGFTSINASGNTGTTVDVTAAAVSNSGVTFTGGASKLVATGSNDAANVKALVTLAGSAAPNWALGKTAVVTIGKGNDASIYTYTATGNATAAEVAAALAAAINANATAGAVVKTTAGAGVNTTGMATQSGGNIVLQSNAAFEVSTAETGANGTIADSLLGGQQVDVITVSGTSGPAETLVATINGIAYTYTSAGVETAAAGATGLAAIITAANVPGVSSAVAVGSTVVITSQLGQTNLVDESGSWAAGSTIAGSINMTTVNNEFITGSGGGEYKAGLGGSFNTVTKKFGSGSETVNLSASTAKVDTLVLKEGAIVTDNGTKGGVTAFTVGSQSASDKVTFQNAADNAVENKTIVANAVTGVVNTLNNAANMAAVFDATGALNTKLANLTYTISNGVITFGATGGNSLSQFTVNELINAAHIIVSSSTTAGAGGNKVVAFSHNGKSYVVASDAANTLAGSVGAGSNTNNVVVELKDVASVKGFGSTFGDSTIVSDTVTNLTNATIDLAALAANSTLDYTGFAKATLAVAGTAAANTNVTKFANLAASAELVVNATAVGTHLGLLETTQVGASGKNSLTVTQSTNASTINRLTVNGDALVQFKNGGQALTVTELVDATNTVNTIMVGAGAGATTIGKITGTALTNINTVAATGTVALGNSAADAIAQNNLKFDLAVGTAATIFASGTGDTFTQGSATTAGTGVVTLTATGANNTITLSNGGNTITANGAGNTISVGTGANTITATGADVTFKVASGAASSITVGTNATVNLGTANVANAGAETIIVDRATTGGTTDNFAKTTISFATGVAATGTVIDFDATVNTAAFTLLGTTMANSQVNVASATSLTEALNMAANYTLLVQDQGTAVTTADLAANTGEITWFQYGGDTYVVAMVNDTAAAVQQTALDANDIVVKLVGLHDLTGANFNAGGEFLTLA